MDIDIYAISACIPVPGERCDKGFQVICLKFRASARWISTRSSKVNLLHAVNLTALFGAKSGTYPADSRGNEPLKLHRVQGVGLRVRVAEPRVKGFLYRVKGAGCSHQVSWLGHIICESTDAWIAGTGVPLSIPPPFP